MKTPIQWQMHDVPDNCWVRNKNEAGRSLVCGVDETGVWVVGIGSACVIDYAALLDRHEYSINNGQDWYPCFK